MEGQGLSRPKRNESVRFDRELLNFFLINTRESVLSGLSQRRKNIP